MVRKKLSFSDVGVFTFLCFGQLATKATSFALLVEEGALAGTSTGEFPVFFDENFDRDPSKRESDQDHTDED